ncbi:hypothetical protein PROQFM164_S02g002727 [Penicillium roqueforti FM164]|uniref:Uncharacterized protein n=1 Tax=Penicillium roqueforti (strain FM164) TaxID=1365484 RepID=W6Q985_PENRF|nr:hypothetical protein PROQFM164_S02g002727 [Penicillium roqueforti FM164]
MCYPKIKRLPHLLGINRPSIDCRSITVSLDNQLPLIASTSTSTESTGSTTHTASSSCELPNTSSFTSISASPSAPSETHSPTTIPSPKGSGELNLNTCLIKEADHREGGLYHCASRSTKVFKSAECTIVH